jgi:tetratricopeptide (TPR) repeat protein
MRLSLHVLLGDFKNHEKAAANIPRDFIMPAYATAAALDTDAVLSDLILMKIVAGDIPSAAVDIQAALSGFSSPAFIRLAAEYFYDFGDLLRSAELFSILPDEAALGRQADALWLADDIDNARAIWAMLATNSGTATVSGEPALRNRALYNFALSAPTLEEEAALLEKLVRERRSAAHGTGGDPSRRFGLIRFSRFLDAPKALAVLAAERESADDPLINLETLRRRTEIAEMARMFAEIWMLIERHPNLEYLYQWGAWYFSLQRNYTENAKLLQIAARNNFSGNWMDFYGALQQIREGHFDAAEELLDAAVGESGHWAALANLGRVLESRRAPARALENYEKAMAAVAESYDISEEDWQNTASRIQVRIALCLKTLGKIDESRRALDYALDLNPDNLTARLELSRLE